MISAQNKFKINFLTTGIGGLNISSSTNLLMKVKIATKNKDIIICAIKPASSLVWIQIPDHD